MRISGEILELVFQRRCVHIFAGLLMALAVACSSTTAIPGPTVEPTVVPTQMPTATVSVTPDTTSIAGALDIVGREVYTQLEELLAELKPRASATDQESNAARYLEDRFEQLGYAAEIQCFTVTEHK